MCLQEPLHQKDLLQPHMTTVDLYLGKDLDIQGQQ